MTSKRMHLFEAAHKPPLCGQKVASGKSYLSAACTTKDRTRVTCKTCFLLMSRAVTEYNPGAHMK